MNAGMTSLSAVHRLRENFPLPLSRRYQTDHQPHPSNRMPQLHAQRGRKVKQLTQDQDRYQNYLFQRACLRKLGKLP